MKGLTLAFLILPLVAFADDKIPVEWQKWAALNTAATPFGAFNLVNQKNKLTKAEVEGLLTQNFSAERLGWKGTRVELARMVREEWEAVVKRSGPRKDERKRADRMVATARELLKDSKSDEIVLLHMGRAHAIHLYFAASPKERAQMVFVPFVHTKPARGYVPELRELLRKTQPSELEAFEKRVQVDQFYLNLAMGVDWIHETKRPEVLKTVDLDAELPRRPRMIVFMEHHYLDSTEHLKTFPRAFVLKEMGISHVKAGMEAPLGTVGSRASVSELKKHLVYLLRDRIASEFYSFAESLSRELNDPKLPREAVDAYKEKIERVRQAYLGTKKLEVIAYPMLKAFVDVLERLEEGRLSMEYKDVD